MHPSNTVTNLLFSQEIFPKLSDIVDRYHDRLYVVGGVCRDAWLHKTEDRPFEPSDIDIVIPTLGFVWSQDKINQCLVDICSNGFPSYDLKENSYFPNGIKLTKKGNLPIDIWIDTSGTGLLDILKTFTFNIQQIGLVHARHTQWGTYDMEEIYETAPNWGLSSIEMTNPPNRPDDLIISKLFKASIKYSIPFSDKVKTWLKGKEDNFLSNYVKAWSQLENDIKLI